MKQFTSKTQKIGEIGEKIGELFLVKHNFKVLERNFTHKMGEIDIVAQKNGRLYFFEVKTIYEKSYGIPIHVTRETQKMADLDQNISKEDDVPRETHDINLRETSVKHIYPQLSEINDSSVQENVPDKSIKDTYSGHSRTYNPFENMSYSKMRKFARVVAIYLIHNHIHPETPWQIDGLGIILFRDDNGKVRGRVERIENVGIR